MSSICTSNVTSGFIDLATFDELEKYCYGGPDATAYFVRETRKSTWFTQVPVVLSRASGSPAFGQEWSVSISRAGDYLLHTWLRVTTPKIQARSIVVTQPPADLGVQLRWTRNFMHNLVRECCITFNDLVAARFDNYHLDFWAAFTVPAGKQNGYNMMIGNFNGMIMPVSSSSANDTLQSYTLNLPLPFFFCRDSGVALPTAALPYNDMRLNFNFRDWDELLIASTLPNPNNAGFATWRRATLSDIQGNVAPQIGMTQVWANYAIVSNDERKRMACAPRDILIEQVQTAPRQTFAPSSVSNPQYDIRFSHAIKVLFFSCRNTTVYSEWSNYTTHPAVPVGLNVVNLEPDLASDPIIATSLIYENTQRLATMGSDYYSLVNPYYFAPNIPTVTGYHMYSYSLDFICLDPMGSTNYGKLTNVSIAPVASESAIDAARGISIHGGQADMAPQTFEFVTTAVNNNIIRVSGGALGFPVL